MSSGQLMKRLLLALFLILILQTSVWAAGDVLINASSMQILGQQSRRIIILSWTADVAAATVPNKVIDVSTYDVMGWYFFSAETNPGTTAPTDDYDIVINDADGKDIAGGLLLNRDTSTTELVCIGTSAHGYPVVRGNLTFVLSNNSVSSATGTCILVFLAN